MIVMLRALLLLGGLGLVLVGGGFLIDPAGRIGEFGLLAESNKGLSTIRADFTAFFWVAGGAMIIGAWKQRGDALLVTAALMGIALTGRAVSLALDGSYEGWPNFMVVEALTVILALTARRALAQQA
jgi:hypothetical protein